MHGDFVTRDTDVKQSEVVGKRIRALLACMAADWLVAARAEPFLPPILKNDPKYSFQIYLTHPRICVIPGGAVATRMQARLRGAVDFTCRALCKRPGCGRLYMLRSGHADYASAPDSGISIANAAHGL